MEFSTYALEVKALSDSGLIEGVAAGYGNIDKGGDVFLPYAFSGSVNAHKAAGTMPAMLMHHDSSSPCGCWNSFEETPAGLIGKGQLTLDASDGRDAFALLRAKAITGLSVGFLPKEFEIEPGTGVRRIKSADLWEVSLVVFPMNPDARVSSVKAAASQRDLEQALRAAGLGARKAKIAAAAAWQAIAGKSDDEPTEQKLIELLTNANAGLARFLETK